MRLVGRFSLLVKFSVIAVLHPLIRFALLQALLYAQRKVNGWLLESLALFGE
jgi:hypothetical protein